MIERCTFWARYVFLFAFLGALLLAVGTFYPADARRPGAAARQQASDTPTLTPSQTSTSTLTPTVTGTIIGTPTLSPTPSGTAKPTGAQTGTAPVRSATPAATPTPRPTQPTPTITTTLIPFPSITMIYPTAGGTPFLLAAERWPEATGWSKDALPGQGLSQVWRLLLCLGVLMIWLALVGWFIFLQRRFDEK